MQTPYFQMILDNDELIPVFSKSSYVFAPLVEEEYLSQTNMMVPDRMDRIDLK